MDHLIDNATELFLKNPNITAPELKEALGVSKPVSETLLSKVLAAQKDLKARLATADSGAAETVLQAEIPPKVVLKTAGGQVYECRIVKETPKLVVLELVDEKLSVVTV